MSANLAGHYALGSNIDASVTSKRNRGAGFAPVGDNSTNFTGTFDGLGHTITGLYINRPSTDYVGLFGYTNAATIRNVGLVSGSVTGSNYVGGLMGYNYGGTISNSYNTGNVTSSGSYSYVGGLVGWNHGAITNSYSTGTVTGTNHYYYVGGLVGWISGTISNSYSTGAVTGTNGVGGLAGVNHYSTISNSYSTGSVTGTNGVGGLVGYNNYGGAITNSYWDTETSGQTTSDGGTGLTTVQMKQQASFSGWDFTNVWGIDEGASYPYLRANE